MIQRPDSKILIQPPYQRRVLCFEAILWQISIATEGSRMGSGNHSRPRLPTILDPHSRPSRLGSQKIIKNQ